MKYVPKAKWFILPKEQANKILHMIHWDLNDLIENVSLNDFKYTLFFFQQLIGSNHGFFLKQKKMLLAMKYLVVIAPYGYVKCIWSNNSAEFTSIPYSLHQNGTAQRF